MAASNFSGEMARVKTLKGRKYINKKGEFIEIKTKGIDAFKVPSESCALVRKNEMWGFIGPDGDWLIEPKFEGGTSFKNGFARMKKNGKWGLINKSGEWVLEPNYANLKSFSLSKMD